MPSGSQLKTKKLTAVRQKKKGHLHEMLPEASQKETSKIAKKTVKITKEKGPSSANNSKQTISPQADALGKPLTTAKELSHGLSTPLEKKRAANVKVKPVVKKENCELEMNSPKNNQNVEISVKSKASKVKLHSHLRVNTKGRSLPFHRKETIHKLRGESGRIAKVDSHIKEKLLKRLVLSSGKHKSKVGKIVPRKLSELINPEGNTEKIPNLEAIPVVDKVASSEPQITDSHVPGNSNQQSVYTPYSSNYWQPVVLIMRIEEEQTKLDVSPDCDHNNYEIIETLGLMKLKKSNEEQHIHREKKRKLMGPKSRMGERNVSEALTSFENVDLDVTEQSCLDAHLSANNSSQVAVASTSSDSENEKAGKAKKGLLSRKSDASDISQQVHQGKVTKDEHQEKSKDTADTVISMDTDHQDDEANSVPEENTNNGGKEIAGEQQAQESDDSSGQCPKDVNANGSTSQMKEKKGTNTVEKLEPTKVSDGELLALEAVPILAVEESANEDSPLIKEKTNTEDESCPQKLLKRKPTAAVNSKTVKPKTTKYSRKTVYHANSVRNEQHKKSTMESNQRRRVTRLSTRSLTEDTMARKPRVVKKVSEPSTRTRNASSANKKKKNNRKQTAAKQTRHSDVPSNDVGELSRNEMLMMDRREQESVLNKIKMQVMGQMGGDENIQQFYLGQTSNKYGADPLAIEDTIQSLYLNSDSCDNMSWSSLNMLSLHNKVQKLETAVHSLQANVKHLSSSVMRKNEQVKVLENRLNYYESNKLHAILKEVISEANKCNSILREENAACFIIDLLVGYGEEQERKKASSRGDSNKD